jgi:predicted nucleotide-binding protein
VARALVSAGLADFCAPALWEFAFDPGQTTIEALEKQLGLCQFAVLVLEPTDVVVIRTQEWGAPRDNVIFELGLFMGALGRGHVFLLCPTQVQVRIPSDLGGVTRLNYEPPTDPKDLQNALIKPVGQLQEAMKKL